MTTMDTLDEDFPRANQFLVKLRDQLDRVDSDLNQAVSFHTNLKKGVMYIRGTTEKEIYMWVLYDYLEKIPDVIGVEFKLPLFGELESIQFGFGEGSSWGPKVVLLSDEVLKECLQTRLADLETNIQEGSK